MKKIIKEKSEIGKSFHDKKSAIDQFKKLSEDYKVKIIEESDQAEDFQIYKNKNKYLVDLRQ